jgi:hypothetical protein
LWQSYETHEYILWAECIIIDFSSNWYIQLPLGFTKLITSVSRPTPIDFLSLLQQPLLAWHRSVPAPLLTTFSHSHVASFFLCGFRDASAFKAICAYLPTQLKWRATKWRRFTCLPRCTQQHSWAIPRQINTEKRHFQPDPLRTEWLWDCSPNWNKYSCQILLLYDH